FGSSFPSGEEEEEGFFAQRRRRDKVREGIVPAWCGFGSSFPSGEEEEEGFFAQRRRRDKVREGIIPAWCAFASSFTSCEEKEKKGFSHKEDEGTKSAKGLFRLGVPLVLCFLGVKKKRRRVFHTKKTKGQSGRRDYSDLVCLRFFVYLV